MFSTGHAKGWHNPPLERTAAAVYFFCGRASRVRRLGRSTALRYSAATTFLILPITRMRCVLCPSANRARWFFRRARAAAHPPLRPWSTRACTATMRRTGGTLSGAAGQDNQRLCPGLGITRMGLDYSFILVTDLERADMLIRELANHLDAEGRQRLSSCLPYDAQVGFRSVRRGEFEQSLFDKHGIQDLCFSFLFPTDVDLLKYAADQSREVQDGKLSVGCVWCSIRSEQRFLAFSATAATTAMSLLFERSAAVKATFADIGRRAGASLVMLDDERPPSIIGIWPSIGRFSLQPGTRPFEDYDSYYSALIERASSGEAQNDGDSAGA